MPMWCACDTMWCACDTRVVYMWYPCGVHVIPMCCACDAHVEGHNQRWLTNMNQVLINTCTNFIGRAQKCVGGGGSIFPSGYTTSSLDAIGQTNINQQGWIHTFLQVEGGKIGGGGHTLILRYTGMCRSKGSLFHKKSLNMVGPITYKNFFKHCSIFQKISVANTRKLWKIILYFEQNP